MKPEDCYYWSTKRKPQTSADYTYFYFTKMLGRETGFDFDSQEDVTVDWDNKKIVVNLDKTPKNRQFMKIDVNNMRKWEDYAVDWVWKKRTSI